MTSRAAEQREQTELSEEDANWLTSQAGCRALAENENLPGDSLVAISQLRREFSPRQAQLICMQWTLRLRAREKFAYADQMLFTRRGLEQATDQWIAAYKSQRLAGRGIVADLCSGIGGDLCEMARLGPVRAVDCNAVMARLAEANVKAVGSANKLEMLAAKISPDMVADCGAWHIDPDRRPRGQRTTQVDLHEPGPAKIDSLLQINSRGCVKIAPAGEIPPHWQESCQREWISRGGECRQQVLWFGELAKQAGARSATLIEKETNIAHSISGEGDVTCPVSERIGEFVYEPDASVIAARLVGHLSVELGLAALASGSMYLTADCECTSPLVTGFRVHEVLPFREAKVKEMLAARKIGRLEVKQRGTQLDAPALQKRLQRSGDNCGVLMITRLGPKVIAILAQRLRDRTSQEIKVEAGD